MEKRERGLIISDVIYGDFKVENILKDLILSQPVQRLKYIHQGGASYLVNEDWNVTRYEHSIGVMLLIKKLGGSVEEQIAGLLHDVSHTAFSHVVDSVFENRDEDYHEEIYNNVIINSDIPAILARYDYQYEDILFDYSKWTLLEQAAPELCADRIDYTLRDMFEYRKITIEEVQDFLNNLIVVEGKIYLRNIEIGEWFVETYYREVIGFFLDPLNIYGDYFLAKTIKTSLEKKLITTEDLLNKDEDIIQKIKASNDNEILESFNQLHQNVQVKEERKNYDIHQKKKVRLVDPSIFNGIELIKASTLSEKVRKMGVEASEKANQGMYVKIISK